MEQQLIDNMASILLAKIKQDYEAGKMKRDAHPKSLGFLKGTFIVADNLPPHLAIGLFATPKQYPCFIRLSNASGAIQSDAKRDIRGFAMKLIGVEGPHVNDYEANTQDFVMLSYHSMPLGTVKLFHDAVYYSIKWHPLALVAKLLLSGRSDILKALDEAQQNQSSSLDLRYWSTTPYQFGDTFAKYSLVPTSSYKSTKPATLTDNYLSENNAQHLRQADASFDFMVQLYKNEQATPIEDAGVQWKESDAPFVKLGTLHIPKQEIATEERTKMGEAMAFSPSNSLKVHAPVGGINRARMQIYWQISTYRTQVNKLQPLQPTQMLYDSVK
jgi:catalase